MSTDATQEAEVARTFAEMVGIRVFEVDDLREGALFLSNSRVVMMDRGLDARTRLCAFNEAIRRLGGA